MSCGPMGAEARIQLQEYTVLEGGRDYFPLADGNIWAYGWADLPDAYVAREVYRATSQVGTQWHLEHFSFAYRK